MFIISKTKTNYAIWEITWYLHPWKVSHSPRSGIVLQLQWDTTHITIQQSAQIPLSFFTTLVQWDFKVQSMYQFIICHSNLKLSFNTYQSLSLQGHFLYKNTQHPDNELVVWQTSSQEFWIKIQSILSCKNLKPSTLPMMHEASYEEKT